MIDIVRFKIVAIRYTHLRVWMTLLRYLIQRSGDNLWFSQHEPKAPMCWQKTLHIGFQVENEINFSKQNTENRFLWRLTFQRQQHWRHWLFSGDLVFSFLLLTSKTHIQMCSQTEEIIYKSKLLPNKSMRLCFSDLKRGRWSAERFSIWRDHGDNDKRRNEKLCVTLIWMREMSAHTV